MIHHLKLCVYLLRPSQCAILLVHDSISRSRYVVRIQVLNVQLNIITWPNFDPLVNDASHSKHFLCTDSKPCALARIVRLLRLAPQAALGHLIELERMGFLQLLTANMFSYGALVLLLSAVKSHGSKNFAIATMCSGRHHRPSHAPRCTRNQRRWLELVTPSTVHSGAGIVSLDVASVALVFWQPTVGACASSIAHRRAQGNLRERELLEICSAHRPLYRPCEA